MKKKKSVFNHSKSAYIMMAPFLILFVITMLIPTVMSLAFSFSDVSSSISFVGLQNFKDILRDPLFFKSYGNVFIFMVGSIPFTIILALVFAVLLNKPTVKGKCFLEQSIIYLL